MLYMYVIQIYLLEVLELSKYDVNFVIHISY